MIELVDPADRDAVLSSIAGQARRIAPTGYRAEGCSAWVRVVGVDHEPYSGFVYSLEVPPTHTFVTTGGLVTSNCFPKDSLALKQLAANSGYHFQLLNAVIEVNELQKRRVVGKLLDRLGSLRGRTVALLGLAFKPNTDDVREAPALVLAGRLLAEGADVRIWDPIARVDDLHGVEEVETVDEAVAGADAVVLVTEWPELAEVDWAALRPTLANGLFVDGRNFLDPVAMRAAGYEYEGVGRAAELHARPGRGALDLMEAIVLAGGQAERLGDAAGGKPKSLVPVGGKPLARLADRPDARRRRRPRDRQLPRGTGGCLRATTSPTWASRSSAPASPSGSAAAAASASRPGSAATGATSSR